MSTPHLLVEKAAQGVPPRDRDRIFLTDPSHTALAAGDAGIGQLARRDLKAISFSPKTGGSALSILNARPRAAITTSSTVGFVSPLAASVAAIISTTISCSALLSRSISALASASWARRPAITALESAALCSGCAIISPARTRSSSGSPSIKYSSFLSPPRVLTASPRRLSTSLIALFATWVIDDILSKVRHSAFEPAHLVISSRVTSSIGSRLWNGVVLPSGAAGRVLYRSGSALVRLRARIRSSGFPEPGLAGLDRLPLIRRAVLEHDLRRIDRGLGDAGSLGGHGGANSFI